MADVGVDETLLKGVAERVAGEAAELVREAWTGMNAGREVRVDTKSADTDVVTAVDHESERLVRARLAELRPDDAVLGEEGGGIAGDGVTWVVDPIDGTVNFLYGLPWFAVSVAAQVGGVSVAGAVVEPVSGRRWTAARGQGAFLDGRPLAVNAPSRLDLTLVGTGFAYKVERRTKQARFVAELATRVRDVRRNGAASLDLCAVAAGWLDAYVEHGLGHWDWAAGALIAAEAGAEVSLPGEDAELGPDATFAVAPSIATPLRQALVDSGVGTI
ncbi:inositol monophosphatase family protein [Amycolatopsis keratiniphila]|uniref:Inositol-1-monophosphatase n=1 Tax=Amycolatopsis keratiniphila subsp. keratiniphila TaxID=227715 RepID=A0A1W2LN50_9PSEU|nr:inositol monophosphatase family protein [Amycolatopsis keratiniphila]ONF64204.1 inositol monophosphatase [Amycolatopsis keratiniphila subsp. keratiniphila]